MINTSIATILKGAHTMSELIAFLNGEYVPISQCKVSVMDIGITTGSSVWTNGKSPYAALHISGADH